MATVRTHASSPRGIAIIAGLGLLVGLTTLLPPTASARALDLSGTPYGGGEMTQAVQTGKPVVVSSLTTETSQVTAEPNGQFQLTSARGPVRAETASGWKPIDTTLHANADGSFSPNVTTLPITFSGGGNTSLVSIGTSALGIDTSWSANLPVPTVSGDTVTYANVRPGVDLVLTAEPDGFTQTLVVKTPAAAQGIVNNPPALTTHGNGVTVSQQPEAASPARTPAGTRSSAVRCPPRGTPR